MLKLGSCRMWHYLTPREFTYGLTMPRSAYRCDMVYARRESFGAQNKGAKQSRALVRDISTFSRLGHDKQQNNWSWSTLELDLGSPPVH